MNPEPEPDSSSSSSSSEFEDMRDQFDSDSIDSVKSVESGTQIDRLARVKTISQKEWKKVTAIKQHAKKIQKANIKKTNRLAKIKGPETFYSKAQKEKDKITFDEYMEKFVR